VLGEVLGEALGEVLGEVLGEALGEVLGEVLGEALGEVLGEVRRHHGRRFSAFSVPQVPRRVWLEYLPNMAGTTACLARTSRW
jgi:hypothetical protein